MIDLSNPINPCQNTESSQNSIDESRKGRFSSFVKFSQTILISPFTTTANLVFRIVKLLTWDPIKAGVYKIGGYHTESAALLTDEYLKTDEYSISCKTFINRYGCKT
jgi:hypothetical protein